MIMPASDPIRQDGYAIAVRSNPYKVIIEIMYP